MTAESQLAHLRLKFKAAEQRIYELDEGLRRHKKEYGALREAAVEFEYQYSKHPWPNEFVKQAGMKLINVVKTFGAASGAEQTRPEDNK